MKARLHKVQDSLEKLEGELEEELLKNEPNYTKLDRLESAVERLAKKEQELLRVLGFQPEGEQWGTAPDAWPTLCGPSSIPGPGD